MNTSPFPAVALGSSATFTHAAMQTVSQNLRLIRTNRLFRRRSSSVLAFTRTFNRPIVRAVEEFVPEEIEMDALERMEKSIDSIRVNFNTVRTGRANTSILDRIEVDYYGAMTPLNTIANATTPDARTILIQPFDKSAINEIEKAIMTSDLGLNPGNDGNCIRLNIPPLTAERRKELAKLVSKLGEDGKVALRNVRRDALKSISKLEGISEDEIKFLEDGIDKLTSEHVKLVDEMVKQKEEDIANV